MSGIIRFYLSKQFEECEILYHQSLCATLIPKAEWSNGASVLF